ncbi:MAG TPA: hypothetical protein VGK85_04080 [Myxococcaceae bacterium]
MASRRWSGPGLLALSTVALLAFPGASEAATDPCKLLTPAEIGGALGATFGAGEPIGTTGCSWTSATPHMIVTVSLWPPAEWDRIKAGGGLPGSKTTPVSGLGDDAFYATVAQYVVLYVKKGQTVYLFKVYGVKDQAKQMSAEKTLAGDALKRL